MKKIASLLSLISIFMLFHEALLAQVPPCTDCAYLICSMPTQNTDGTPIVNPIAVEFFHGTAPGVYTESKFADTCTASFTGLAPGAHYFAAKAVVNGIKSAFSNEASKVIPPPTPNPPTGLTVQQDLTVWGMVISRNRVAMIPVGTVVQGTQCDATQRVLDKYVVPRELVLFAGSVRPQVVFATCG